MANNASNNSSNSQIRENEEDERPTSISLGNCTRYQNGPEPSTSKQPEEKGLVLKRTQSEPNRLQPHIIKSTPLTFITDLLKTNIITRACDASIPSHSQSPGACDCCTTDETRNRISSKFSLRFQSEILNIANRNNFALKSSVRFKDDDAGRHQTIPTSSTMRTDHLPATQPQGEAQDLSEINAEITVLYSDSVSFNSSESLIAKDSMGQSRLKGTSTTVAVCTTQPPPYHVATANDTASVQLTPAAAPPLVLYSAPPLQGAPPTYSALMRIGPEETCAPHRLFSRRDVQIQPSSPFIAPPPPPSYAQAQGYCVAHPLQFADPHDSVWSTEPITVICPYCNNFVVTTIRFRRSNLTHYSALALCICGCWPCCLLPYCMKSCKCVHHECPVCSNVVGIYSPWQVS